MDFNLIFLGLFEAFDEDMNMIDEMGKVYCVVFCFFVETEKKRKTKNHVVLFCVMIVVSRKF